MPLGEDWTAAFRACPSVRRYVLLGEMDDGCCGRPCGWRVDTPPCVAESQNLFPDLPRRPDSPPRDSAGGSPDRCQASQDLPRSAPISPLRWETWGYLPPGGDRGSCSVSSTSSGDGEEGEEVEEAEEGGEEGEEGEEEEGGEAWRRVYARSPHATPWGQEGWHRRELHELSAVQLCRTDAPWCSTRHSHTVVFTRGLDRG